MNKNLILPSGRTLSDVVTGVTVNDRTTERSDAVFMAKLLREMYEQESVAEFAYVDPDIHDCSLAWDTTFVPTIGQELFAKPVPWVPTGEIPVPRETLEAWANDLALHGVGDIETAGDIALILRKSPKEKSN